MEKLLKIGFIATLIEMIVAMRKKVEETSNKIVSFFTEIKERIEETVNEIAGFFTKYKEIIKIAYVSTVMPIVIVGSLGFMWVSVEDAREKTDGVQSYSQYQMCLFDRSGNSDIGYMDVLDLIAYENIKRDNLISMGVSDDIIKISAENSKILEKHLFEDKKLDRRTALLIKNNSRKILEKLHFT
ncbi:MAG: hypothetical protein N4A44_03600 [Alphaproteobacteria bacterium]|jgi:hypothetical protein|nr:hypothetical protein [Alphaproteobacteria bacterium]